MATGACRQALPLTVAILRKDIRFTTLHADVGCKPEISVTAIARHKIEPHAVRTQAAALRKKAEERAAERRRQIWS